MQNLLFTPPKTTKAILDKLANLNINSNWDLLLHIPLRYEDLTSVYPIIEAKVGTQALVEGEIVSCEVIHKRTKQLQVRISDKTEVINLLFFHFYPNYMTQYKVGKIIRAFGEVKLGSHGQKVIVHPKIQTVSEDLSLPKTFSPIYSIVQGLSQAQITKLIEEALAIEAIPETIPLSILKKGQLISFNEALVILHKLTPQQFQENIQHKALHRLKVDELLAQQLILYNVYQQKHQSYSQALKPLATLTAKLIKQLPFKLTQAQIKVLAEIYADIAKPKQMNRLLQGDVGSGKTIVATLLMLVAVENGFQACIMAPTEILAEQHYLKTKSLLDNLGLKVVWLASSLTKTQKKQAYKEIESGIAQIVIGTHAVFQRDVVFNNLALVVIDEQHRFGVEQRLLLQNKGTNPHQLMMSATPIPRTLAMSYYADLDISTIDELPPHRTTIKTVLVNNNRRSEVVEFILKMCQEGRQVYWVCPLIDESETLELENVLNTYADLSAHLVQIAVGLVHGRLKASEKAEIMQAFRDGTVQVLVATTVIEVGVDVPNASIMVIEHSERMGLSQLHQLRGRVGRGSIDSQCILLYQNPLGDIAKQRLKAIYENTDGFKIAEQDLLIRGPGELLGSRQSGLPALKFADLETDLEVLRYAKDLAKIMLHDYPDLARLHTDLWFYKQEHFLKV